MLKNAGYILFDKIKYRQVVKKDTQAHNLKSEKENVEKALRRLEDLYIFPDDIMSEKDYLIKRQELKKRISYLEDEISKRYAEHSKTIPKHDLSFLNKASQYLLTHNLVSENTIKYNELVKVIDKKMLRSFMQRVIKKITIEENKHIFSIEFANDMIHRFVYRI
ncbi:putative resolvase [Gottschalkia acidurici 9a]|uniref:Resolvase n=1 Tax=Gottschalkia acidurici (strain ATCC 7906 / DSM 604 / BCRC 14475 / CIP 104303 / KCTC 5404 / NCIMB 10678 / 9a) TaxID=1128398 RepID=K0AZ07_GOTA9|nr:hypothetical protein [Gottschalkia acidurici]AFS78494.1 putative resolvase [Gottschalkia acidurici 9a]